MKLGNINVEIKAIPNYSARTFTIRKVSTDIKTGAIHKAKYRTERFNHDDFDMHLSSTFFDWLNYLKYSQSYYKV